MPYSSTVNDNAYQIDTGENSPQQEITIDGNTYKIDWRSIAPLAANKGPGQYRWTLQPGHRRQIIRSICAAPHPKRGRERPGL